MLYFGTIASQNEAIVTDIKKNIFTDRDLKIDNDSIIKVSFKNNFKEKYQGDEFIYKTELDQKNVFDKLMQWLQDKLSQLFNFGVNDTSINIIGIVLKTIGILIIIFVIYLIVKSILNKEGQWIFGKNSDRNILNYDDIEKNLTTTNFENLISQTLKNRQNRLTVRYYYLWLLKMMIAREIIVWDVEKTNSDYIQEIQNDTFKEEFIYLSYLYNHVWYGEFEVNNDTFEKSKTAFETAIQRLKR
jgi:hypothetical protein